MQARSGLMDSVTKRFKENNYTAEVKRGKRQTYFEVKMNNFKDMEYVNDGSSTIDTVEGDVAHI